MAEPKSNDKVITGLLTEIAALEEELDLSQEQVKTRQEALSIAIQEIALLHTEIEACYKLP